MLFVFFRIIGAGVGVVVAQALGGNKRAAADAAARAAWGASSWIGGICMLLAGGVCRAAAGLMNAPPEVLPLAVPLLQLMAPAVLLDAWNSTAASVLRSHLHARPTMVVNITMQVVHLALAVPLMGGALGLAAGWAWPAMPWRCWPRVALGLGLFLQAWHTRLGGVPPGATGGSGASARWPGAAHRPARRGRERGLARGLCVQHLGGGQHGHGGPGHPRLHHAADPLHPAVRRHAGAGGRDHGRPPGGRRAAAPGQPPWCAGCWAAGC